MGTKGTLIRLDKDTGDTQIFRVDMLAPEGTDERIAPINEAAKRATEKQREIIARDAERLRDKS
jgi:hypothetical protein